MDDQPRRMRYGVTARLVLFALVAFSAGMSTGLAAMIPVYTAQKAELSETRKEVAKQAAKAALAEYATKIAEHECTTEYIDRNMGEPRE